jgi:hypothetical protein
LLCLYEKLLDLKHDSPIYTGLKLDTETLSMTSASSVDAHATPPSMGTDQVKRDYLESQVTDADLDPELKNIADILASTSSTWAVGIARVRFKEGLR